MSFIRYLKPLRKAIGEAFGKAFLKGFAKGMAIQEQYQEQEQYKEIPTLKGTPLISAKAKKGKKQACQTTSKNRQRSGSIVLGRQLEAWIAKKQLGSMNLEEQWDEFCRKALANGYQYQDWYAAFQNWLTSPFQKANGVTPAQQPVKPHKAQLAL